MDFLFILLFLFIVGTVVLSRTKHERYFVVFLMRTKRLLNFIDKVALLAPRLWRFLSDLAIVVSFSGLGIAYLSRYRNLSRNLYPIMALLGVTTILLWWQDPITSFILFLILISIILMAQRFASMGVDFIFGTSMFLLIWGRIFSVVGVETTFVPVWILILIVSIFGLPVLLFMVLMQSAYEILQGSDFPGISPALPTVKDGEVGLGFPGLPIFIPWSHALIAIAVTIAVHEFAHGILTRVRKLNLKSTGLVTLGILPIGAFVEPDDDEMKKVESIDRMRIFAVGSFANLMTAVLALGLLMCAGSFAASELWDYELKIVHVEDGSPADGVLEVNMTLYGLNNQSVKTVEEFREVTPEIKPDTTLEVLTDQGTFHIKTIEHPEHEGRGYIGIGVLDVGQMREETKEKYGYWLVLFLFIMESLKWILFFNANIGLVNLLPIPPFDGGKMFFELMSIFNLSEMVVRRILYTLIIFGLMILLVNTLPLFNQLIGDVCGLLEII